MQEMLLRARSHSSRQKAEGVPNGQGAEPRVLWHCPVQFVEPVRNAAVALSVFPGSLRAKRWVPYIHKSSYAPIWSCALGLSNA